LRPYLKKPFTKIGLVEWHKVKALSSSPSTTKKRKKKKKKAHVSSALENNPQVFPESVFDMFRTKLQGVIFSKVSFTTCIRQISLFN
jgi:hypothetical protein